MRLSANLFKIIMTEYKTIPSDVKLATEMLLYRTYIESWRKGEKYFDEGRVKIIKFDEQKIKAEVFGSKLYKTSLSFRSGGLSRKCTCPVNDFCKHLVAVAIAWDTKRGYSRPSQGTIEDEAIPAPLISRAEIDKLYQNPLKANLEVLRLASSESGSWSRPHARLPNIPRIEKNPKTPLTLKEIEKFWAGIRCWEGRRAYDYYFCAGEMVAAFCEVMRIIDQKLKNTKLSVAIDILLSAQKFHHELICDLIDDSDGLHIFTEAHLENLYKELKIKQINNKNIESSIEEKLNYFVEHRDDY